MARPTYDPQYLLVGVIGRPHGLQGEVTLRSHNERGANLVGVPALLLDRGDAREEHKVLAARHTNNVWLVRLEGVASRDAAAALTHAAVWVRRQSLPPLGPGEFFVEDVRGCTIRDEQGHVLGIAESVFWNGAQDVMVVSGEVEHLIPLVPEVVRIVDAAQREVIVDWQQDE
jgi:16S rRNA processing protein RimM